MSLSRDQILAKQDDVPTATVDVPEWGDGATVRLRGLSAQQRWDWAKVQNGNGEGPEPSSLLVAFAAIDDDGKPLFQTQDVDALAQLRGDVVGRLAEKVMELSGLADEAGKDAEGNSDATPSGDSPSDLPETSDAPSEN